MSQQELQAAEGNYESNTRLERRIQATEGATSAPASVTPSTIKQDGDFTTQAALSLTRATQTSNIVNSRAYDDIMFRTTTAGVIKTIEMDFPEGTYVGSALLVEAVGIGPGKITSDNVDDKVIYTVTNAVNVPANTNIRIQLANINNPPECPIVTPPLPPLPCLVFITTKLDGGATLDGPTATSPYTMKQIGTNEVAEDFMKRVTLYGSGPNAHELGWEPDGVKVTFTITEPAITRSDSAFVSLWVRTVFDGTHNFQVVRQNEPVGTFMMQCQFAPEGSSLLHYIVQNLPPHSIF